MTRTAAARLALAFLLMLSIRATAQQSDYAIKNEFEERHAALQRGIASATTTAGLDSLRNGVDGLELDFMQHSSFLNDALYPSSFEGAMTSLRENLRRAADRLLTIETQGEQLRILDDRLDTLIVALDSLKHERERLLADLKTHKADAAALREIVRRLQNTLQAKDRLLFALVDSMFQRYSSPPPGLSDTQREELALRLERGNVLSRIADVARENSRFLATTEFQPRDFGTLIDTYRRFATRWEGLSPSIRALALGEASGVTPAGTPAAGTGAASRLETPIGDIDSAVAAWRVLLHQQYWSSLQKEFAVHGIPIPPFTDAASFSSSIRSYVEQMKADGDDATVFVETVWKARIDKEWRESLTREGMLGKEEYAALDALVSELARHTVDLRFLLYVGLAAAFSAFLWWFFARKPKTPAA